jgi:hypothetical protein
LIDWHFVYRYIADRLRGKPSATVCLEGDQKPHTSALPERRPYPLVTAVVGGFLIVGNVLFGVRHDVYAYPFACYPTFAAIARQPHASRILCFISTDGQRYVPVDPAKEIANAGLLPFYRFHALFGHILDQDPEKQGELFKALWRMMERVDPKYKEVRMVRFYRELLMVGPEEREATLVDREVLFEWVRRG